MSKTQIQITLKKGINSNHDNLGAMRRLSDGIFFKSSDVWYAIPAASAEWIARVKISAIQKIGCGISVMHFSLPNVPDDGSPLAFGTKGCSAADVPKVPQAW
jgi:hypothetical protein